MSQTMTSSLLKTTMIVGDQSLDVADLEVINFEKIAAKDPVEMAKLLKAAESTGFFFFSFNNELSETMSNYLQTCYQNSEGYFTKPLDEKMKDFREDVDRGYKHRPGVESYEIARDEQNSIALPTPFAAHAGTTNDFIDICDTIVRACLRSLSDSLGLGGSSHLENSHPPEGPSDSGLKFVSSPTLAYTADVPDSTHTDSGSVTLLWCEKWASQLQTKETKEWLWIEPKRDCVLINLANYLQNQTGDRLHSPVHRLMQPSDGVEDRHFVSYFLRPTC
ncbi:unnamed protein product [Penicillium salamii]|uniref:Isopenicillin N synthase-like Fe(2+) 2OG dioxygenase domain-containing protein n=1 Tax=Penicillium salamii TaxID=1612424 RepID=A0A9W4J3Q3_9EURO|nr:unnamed protein product [Penicillium salamii]CAG8035250.1 unnamed protein product [Penicillium salamii]CAG8056357.1 unnamed protein product [Penicillium salamii]CAG8113173.1 unnamed protein product [Penicillium salamii]CAG8262888.1 unnamed protein product [Penicillium salamii]